MHTNVSDWPVTSTLGPISVSNTHIDIPYDKAGQWPLYGSGDDAVDGNLWVFVNWEGKWYAATWEWLRPGQTRKFRYAVNGDHIKKSPLDRWSPRSGEILYFMVSGLARFSERNIHERTNIVKFVWP